MTPASPYRLGGVVRAALGLGAILAALGATHVRAQTAAPSAKVRADAVTISGPTVAGSFCSTAEVAVFHCSTGAKQVSVCASRTATAQAGSLRYFFGKPGARAEITLPAKATAPSRSASADTVTYSGGGGAWLRFRSGEYAYTVFTATGRSGYDGPRWDREGLLVERQGRRVAYLPCRTAAESQLGPDLYGTLGLRPLSADESFDLPE
jgi:hypothetical protein